MSFGYALKKFREERGLSLRELGKLCEVDHAYICRLENGEKKSPSREIVNAFINVLKLSRHKAKLLHFLWGKNLNVPDALLDAYINHAALKLELLKPLASVPFKHTPINEKSWLIKYEELERLCKKYYTK